MNYKLYLDDVKPIPIDWVGARSFKEFTDFIKKNGIPEKVSFDHDLFRTEYHVIKDRPANRPLIEFPIDYNSYKHKTGYHCAKWLFVECHRLGKPLPEWTIHSDNSTGSTNIKNVLEKGKRAPFDKNGEYIIPIQKPYSPKQNTDDTTINKDMLVDLMITTDTI